MQYADFPSNICVFSVRYHASCSWLFLMGKIQISWPTAKPRSILIWEFIIDNSIFCVGLAKYFSWKLKVRPTWYQFILPQRFRIKWHIDLGTYEQTQTDTKITHSHYTHIYIYSRMNGQKGNQFTALWSNYIQFASISFSFVGFCQRV